MNQAPAKIALNVTSASQLPDQLVISGGRLRLKTGEEPTFENIPDGTVVSLVPRDDLARLLTTMEAVNKILNPENPKVS